MPSSSTGMMRCWNLVLVAEKTRFLIMAHGSRSIFSHLHVRWASHPSPGIQQHEGLCSPYQHIAASPAPREDAGREERAEQPRRQQDPAHAAPNPSARPGTRLGANKEMPSSVPPLPPLPPAKPPARAGQQQLFLRSLMTRHKLNMKCQTGHQ